MSDTVPMCVNCKKEIEVQLIRSPFTKEAFHLDCFNCANCKKNFHKHNLMKSIYDFKGKPWCGECYSDEFSSRCAECTKPIKEDHIEALGAVFHRDCFMTKKRSLRCIVCHRSFNENDEIIDALEVYFHEDCFKCSTCGKQFDEYNPPGEKKGKFICKRCHADSLMDTEKCCQCNGNIMTTEAWTIAVKLKVHEKCFKCAQCNTPLAEVPRFNKGGKLYCNAHK